MITYIKGVLAHKSENDIIIETGGIGYSVFVSSALIAKLPAVGETAQVFTYLSVREDGISLFGFSDKQELSLFNMLITVSGIGPKGALSLLSAYSASDIIFYIVTDNPDALTKASGIGKKTAQRIVLELKDKLKTDDIIKGISKGGMDVSESNMSLSANKEAILALTSLGYTKADAVNAVYGLNMGGEAQTEDVIKLALKKLAKKL